MNETLKTILSRSSIRRFTDEPLTEEQIKALGDAALAAPSGGNVQNWQFIFCPHREMIQELEDWLVADAKSGNIPPQLKPIMEARNWRILNNAALLVLIVTKGGENQVDAGIACENIVLAAQSMGLTSCIVGGPRTAFSGDKKEYFKEKFHFPAGYEFVVGVTIGHAAMENAPHAPQPEKLTIL